jgi:hypothetical protein
MKFKELLLGKEKSKRTEINLFCRSLKAERDELIKLQRAEETLETSRGRM